MLLATSTLAVFAPLPAAPSARPDSILRDVAVMPGDVMLDEPGEGPRELLRYGIPHDLQVDFRVELRDAASYVVVTGQCTLGQAPLLDKLEADCTVERVILGPRELARMWIYATIDRRGQATSLRARHDPRLSHALADQIAVALVRFEPLPEQAVGAGAVWREDVDMIARTITVRQQTCNGVTTTPKGRTRRTVPMTTTLHEALERMSVVREGFVVRNADGSQKSDGEANWWMARICRKAGLPVRYWHTLRHGFGTHAALFGVNPWRLQSWMGHKRIEETMLYVHVAETHARELPQEIRDAAIGEADPDARIVKMLGARGTFVPRTEGSATGTVEVTAAQIVREGVLEPPRCYPLAPQSQPSSAITALYTPIRYQERRFPKRVQAVESVTKPVFGA